MCSGSVFGVDSSVKVIVLLMYIISPPPLLFPVRSLRMVL